MSLNRVDVLEDQPDESGGISPEDKQAITNNKDKNDSQDVKIQENETLDAEQAQAIQKNKDDLTSLDTKLNEHIEKDILEDNDIETTKSIKFNKGDKTPIEIKVETDETGDNSKVKTIVDGKVIETKDSQIIKKDIPTVFADTGRMVYGDIVDNLYLISAVDYAMIKLPIPKNNTMFRIVIRGGRYDAKPQEWVVTLSGYLKASNTATAISNFNINMSGSLPKRIKFYAFDANTLEKRIYIGPLNNDRYVNIVIEEVQLFHNSDLMTMPHNPPTIDIATAQEVTDLTDKLNGGGDSTHRVKEPRFSKNVNISDWFDLDLGADDNNNLIMKKANNVITMTNDVIFKHKSFYDELSLYNIYGDYVSAYYSIGSVRYLTIDIPLIDKTAYNMTTIKLESYNFLTKRTWEDTISFYLSGSTLSKPFSFASSTGMYQPDTKFMAMFNTENKDRVLLILDRGEETSDSKYTAVKIKSIDIKHIVSNEQVTPTIRASSQLEKDVYQDRLTNTNAIENWVSVLIRRQVSPHTKIGATINGESKFGISQYMNLRATDVNNAFLNFEDKDRAQTFYIGHGNVGGDTPSARLKSNNPKFVFDFDNNVRFIKGIKISPDDIFHKASTFIISPFDKDANYEFPLEVNSSYVNIECTYMKDDIVRNVNSVYPANTSVDLRYDKNDNKVKVGGLGALSAELQDSYILLRVSYGVDREGN